MFERDIGSIRRMLKIEWVNIKKEMVMCKMIEGLMWDDGGEVWESSDGVDGMDGSINDMERVIIYVNVFFRVRRFGF